MFLKTFIALLFLISSRKHNISRALFNFYALSGRIGKVVATHAAVARSVRFLLCTRRSGGTAHEGGGCDQSIGSTVSDAIVRRSLWLTATRSSPLGCFSTLLQVVAN